MATRTANLFVHIGVGHKAFAAQMGAVEKSFKMSALKMQASGRALSMGLTLPIIGIGAAAIKTAVDFNKGMANVATLIPGQTKRIEELGRAVDDMTVRVGKGAKDLTAGLYQVISAFQDTGDTMKILEINAKAAVAGLASTEQAIALTSAVTKAYGDTTALAVAKAADLAFETVRLGQTTFPQLAGSIGQVTPMAAKMNVGLTELFSTFATLTGVTGNTAQVATQMSGVLRAMIKPTTAMAAAIDKLGYGTTETMVRSLGLVGALRQIIGTTDGTSRQIGKLFGRARALTAVFALTGGQAETFDKKFAEIAKNMESYQLFELIGDDIDEFEKRMLEVGGISAMEKAFIEQTKGVNAFGWSLKKLGLEIVKALRLLGKTLIPVLQNDALPAFIALVAKVGDAVRWFSNLDASGKKTAVTIAAIAAAAGPVLMVLGTMAAAIGALISPAGLIVLAIVAVIAVFVKFRKEITAAFTSLCEWTKDLSLIFGVLFKAMLIGWGSFVTSLREWMKDLGMIFSVLFEAALIGWDSFVSDVVGFAKDIYEGVKGWIVDKFTGILDKLKEWGGKIKDVFSSIKDFVVGNSVIPEMVTGVGKWFEKMREDTTASTLGMAAMNEAIFHRMYMKTMGYTKEWKGGMARSLKDIKKEWRDMKAWFSDEPIEVPGLFYSSIEKIPKFIETQVMESIGWFDALALAMYRTGEEITGLNNNAFQDMQAMYRDWAYTLEDVVLKGLKTARWEFRSFVDAVIADLTRLLMRYMLIGPMFKAIASWLPGVGDWGTSDKSTPTETPKPPPILTSSAPPPMMAGASAGGGNVVLQIIDQRSAGAPPIEYEEDTLADGTRVARAFVRGEIQRAHASGDMRQIMFGAYGARYRGGVTR